MLSRVVWPSHGCFLIPCSGTYEERVCTHISGHHRQLESDFIYTFEALRKYVAIERGHVVWQCMLSGMDNLYRPELGTLSPGSRISGISPQGK